MVGYLPYCLYRRWYLHVRMGVYTSFAELMSAMFVATDTHQQSFLLTCNVDQLMTCQILIPSRVVRVISVHL